MSQAYINNEKTHGNGSNTKNKTDFDFENLIKNKNLKNVNIFKTNTQVKNNDDISQMNYKMNLSYNITKNDKIIGNLNFNDQGN